MTACFEKRKDKLRIGQYNIFDSGCFSRIQSGESNQRLMPARVGSLRADSFVCTFLMSY